MPLTLAARSVLRRNHVVQLGRGACTLLLAHGFGCDQTIWRDVVPVLARRYRVVLFDFVGAGASDRAAYDATRYASQQGYAQDVREICAALGLRSVVFVGHSASAMVGALAAIAEPERFEHLVMVAPSPRYINDPPDYVGGFERSDIDALFELMEHNLIGWSESLAPRIVNRHDRPQLTRELSRRFCAMDPEIARRWARTVFLSDHRADLARVSTPCLIMQCSEDMIAPLSVGRYLHAHLARSTLWVMKATGHCPHLSEPAEFIALLDDYLAGQGLGG